MDEITDLSGLDRQLSELTDDQVRSFTHTWLSAQKSFNAARRLIDTLLAADRGELAVQAARDWRALAPAPIERADVLMALTLERAGQDSQAAAAWLSLAEGAVDALTESERLHVAERMLSQDRLGAARQAFPDAVPVLLSARLATLLCRSGDFERARQVLSCVGPEAPELNASHRVGLGRAGIVAGMTEFAIGAFVAAVRDSAAEPVLVERALQHLMSIYAGTPAREPVVNAILSRFGSDGTPAGRAVMLRAALWCEDTALITQMAEALASTSPLTPDDALNAARLLQQAGFPENALATAQAGAGMAKDSAQRAAIEVCIIQCLAEMGRSDEALERARSWIDKPEGTGVRRSAFLIARATGARSEQARFVSEAIDSHRGRIPGSLAAAIEDITERSRTSRDLASGRMAAAWRLSQRPLGDWSDWQVAYRWGEETNALLINWLVYADAERQRDMDGLICGGDADLVEANLAQGRGLLLAGTHMGPAALALRYLLSGPWKASYIGMGGRGMQRPGEICVTDLGQARTLHTVRSRLCEGGIVSMAQDTRGSGRPGSLVISGQRFEVSRLTPRLAFTEKIPTCFVHAEWRGDKAFIRIEQLPGPMKNERAPDFEKRWLRAYGEKVEGILTGPAQNISNLALRASWEPDGIWLYRTMAPLQRRSARAS